MAYSQEEINLNVPLTKDYAQNLRWVLAANEPYTAAKIIARDFLGGRKTGENQALFGFWMPGLVDGDLRGREQQITLELFTPLKPLDFPALKRGEARSVRFGRRAIPLQPAGDYLVAVVDAVRLGSRAAAGTFYWLRYDDGKRRHIIRDPLAASTPFGVYAPAELFDAAGMLAGRQDMDYFQNHYREIYPDGSYRARDIGTHLEIHPETATAEGTIAALTRRYREIGRKIQANIDAGREEIYAGLTPAELNFVAFDTIELTPEVPQAEREGAPSPSGEFFQFRDDPSAGEVAVEIKRPDISNWGYDTPILGSAAVNPSILATLRPNEFLDFIETIHTLPGRPIQLCIDSVLGHCDFQGARLLQTFERATPPADQDNLQYINSKYLRGANMYGRDIDFSVPEVKALLLEMLVRKLNYGYDCVRVDGAQDFLKAMDEISGMRIQDDDFLNEMANVVQEINGLTRRLDFNN